MNLSYHPLFNNLILSRVFHYYRNFDLKLVHPFWNEIHLGEFGKYPLYQHPWIKTHEILKKIGIKYSSCDLTNCEVVESKICKKKGLLIRLIMDYHYQLHVYFLDFTGQFCVKKSFNTKLGILYWIDLHFFPHFFCLDHQNHYLMSVKFESRLFVFDYSDLENISVTNSWETQEQYDHQKSAFSVVFGNFYYLNFEPWKLKFFDLSKFEQITKHTENRLNQAKFLWFDKACYFICNTKQNLDISKISPNNDIEYTSLLYMDADRTKKIERFDILKFLSHYLLLVCSFDLRTTIVFYDLTTPEPFKKPYFVDQLSPEFFDGLTVITMSDNLIAFHDTDNLIVLNLATKSYFSQITDAPLYLEKVERFYPTEDNIFICLQRSKNRYGKITFDLKNQSFTRTKNFILLNP
jgi:hypothetical protein